MLDVLHYYMEEDYMASTAEEMERHSKVRSAMYEQLYNTTYKYATTQTQSAGQRQYIDPDDMNDDLSDVVALNPTAKPYTPPTEFNPESPDPFGGVLDTPLG